MSKVNEITSSSQLQRLLGANKAVIVDFYATWCGPCKVISPVFEQLATSHSAPGRLAFAKVDTDRNSDIVSEHGVSAMPTFLVFKNGRVENTIRGANASALRSAVARAAADARAGDAAPGAHFASKGYRLGSADDKKTTTTTTRVVRGVAPAAALDGMRGFLGMAIRFVVLYFTTLFSFDAYVAAEASPFSVKERSDRKNR